MTSTCHVSSKGGTRRDSLCTVLLCALVYVVALVVRLHELDAAQILADSLGPWLVAEASILNLQAHAAPYGWALSTPYAMILPFAGSLRQAVALLAMTHALVAPLGSLTVLSFHRKAWSAGSLVGLLLALDGSLLDTCTTGSESYLAPFWIGMATLGLSRRTTGWGPVLAALSWAMAVMNHPIAVTALPLLLLLPLRRPATRMGVALAFLALLPQILRLPASLSGGVDSLPVDAISSWFAQGWPGSVLIALGPIVGLCHRETRPLASAVLASLLLLLMGGAWGGYLRDHHLRILEVPALIGWACLPGRIALLPAIFLRLPPTWLPLPGHPDRPGTIGLEADIANQILALRPTLPLMVDGALLSGTAAVEPAAVLLDLRLRGWKADDLAPGGSVVLVVSGNRPDLESLPFEKPTWLRRNPYFLVIGDAGQIRSYTGALCGRLQRHGGAWDGMAVLHPEMTLEETTEWWDPCFLEDGSGYPPSDIAPR